MVADLIAGITVGLTVLPQGLAYATLAGLEPQVGLVLGRRDLQDVSHHHFIDHCPRFTSSTGYIRRSLEVSCMLYSVVVVR
uniref:Putative secreted protein n=1 Tax=Anopheles marajoara TaxID=58244 RepID=A0A2M4CBI8_9DIPT